jgi:hypothetical protein
VRPVSVLVEDGEPDAATVERAFEERDRLFRRLPRVDAVFVPSGDPGDVDPRILLPFVEKQKEVLSRSHPGASVWVSPQNCGDDEDWLELFLDTLRKEEPPWRDGILFGPAVEMSLADVNKLVWSALGWDPATDVDEPLNDRRDPERRFARIRELPTEDERLRAVRGLLGRGVGRSTEAE